MPLQTYRVAQRLLSIDPALPEMATRRVDGHTPAVPDHDIGFPQPFADESVFRGEGLLGPVLRHIECRWSQHGYSLQVDGVGRFRISANGRCIYRSEAVAATAGPPEQLTETVLGPAMTLALALQGVWCLHASAVEYGGEMVAFLGPSGAGKSTLGRELPRGGAVAAGESHGPPRLRCGADDVLPVTLDEGAIRALPRFPQLKFGLDHQPGDALAPSLPLREIYVLEPSHDPGDVLSAEPLVGAHAVLALVRHTVAARLFTKDLLRRHLEFCACLADLVKVSRLRYPHRTASLDQARELLFPQVSKCCS